MPPSPASVASVSAFSFAAAAALSCGSFADSFLKSPQVPKAKMESRAWKGARSAEEASWEKLLFFFGKRFER